MCEWMNGFSDVAVVLLCLCLMLFTGFLVTRATKLLRLPNVSGYIIAGILLGPGVLHAIPDSFLNGISFVSDLAPSSPSALEGISQKRCFPSQRATR